MSKFTSTANLAKCERIANDQFYIKPLGYNKLNPKSTYVNDSGIVTLRKERGKRNEKSINS